MNQVQQATHERTLDELLNIGHNTFEHFEGPIPETVGGIRSVGREFAGGNIVHRLRLEALQSGDRDRILQGFGEKHYDLADACITFENLVKLQPDSTLLKGIRGVVETQDGLYVAIDAKAVESALKNGGMQYFKVSEQEIVNYIINGKSQQETASDVVLLPYNRSSLKFTPEQFRAINVPEIKRSNIIYNRDVAEEEIVRDGKVLPNTAWGILYPAELIVPLVQKTFEFNREEWSYDTNMGLFLPTSEPKNNAEGRALFVGRLWDWSRLGGRVVLGVGGCRLVGVGCKYAEGVAQKLAPQEQDLLTAYRRGDAIFTTPKGFYVKTAAPIQLKQ